MGFITSIFKTPDYHRFSYKPMYYDERKEARERRIEQIKRQVEAEKSGRKPSVAEAYSEHRKLFRETKRKANRRMLIIFGFLLILVYLFIND